MPILTRKRRSAARSNDSYYANLSGEEYRGRIVAATPEFTQAIDKCRANYHSALELERRSNQQLYVALARISDLHLKMQKDEALRGALDSAVSVRAGGGNSAVSARRA
jgi:hypothetical protein